MASIRYDLSLSARMLRALPVFAFYCVVVIFLYSLVPSRVLQGGGDLLFKGILTVGLIGFWRYSWQLTHIIRAALFEHVKYPRMQMAIDQMAEEEKYPERLVFVVPTVREKPEVSKQMLASLLRETKNLPSKVTIVISSDSEEEDAVFKNYLAGQSGSSGLDIRYIRQLGGKRGGMAAVLSSLMHEKVDKDDILVLMDGDTVLGVDIFKKCLPLFKHRPNLGAVTTDNISVTEGNFLYRKWYTLRFAMRHRMMKSQSYSNRLLVLTGRFSVFRACHVLNDEFIAHIENDRVKHWLHGEIKFVTGDDKSTWFCLLKKGVEMLYVPDAHIYCLEDSGPNPLRGSISKMHRWFGNMLRNNGRAIALGPGPQPFFNWWCLVDQRISMWTTLIGPVSALWLSIFVTPWAFALYMITVIFMRSFYLMLLAIEGHRVSIWDIPMLMYTHWVGSMVKIYTLFHLHCQSWGVREAENRQKGEGMLTSVVPKMQVALASIAFAVGVALVIGVK